MPPFTRAWALALILAPLSAPAAIGVPAESSDLLGQLLWSLWALTLLAQLTPALLLGLALTGAVARWMGARIHSPGGSP